MGIYVKCLLCFLIWAQDCEHFNHTHPFPPSLIFDFVCLYYMHVVKPLSSGWTMSTNKCAGLRAASHKIGALFWFLNEDINNLCSVEIGRIRTYFWLCVISKGWDLFFYPTHYFSTRPKPALVDFVHKLSVCSTFFKINNFSSAARLFFFNIKTTEYLNKLVENCQFNNDDRKK